MENKYKKIISNIIGVAVVIALFFTLKHHKGYGFVFKMLESNYKTISANMGASLDERNEMKLGYSYNFFKYLCTQTPEDAVIYLPGKAAFMDKSNGIEFTGEPYIKGWASRFLHPRKVVLESEYSKSNYRNMITHIAIVNKKGTEIMPQKVENLPALGVLPVQLRGKQRKQQN